MKWSFKLLFFLALADVERELIRRALERNGGSRKRSAEELRVNRATLFNKMKKYNLMDLAFGEPKDPRS